MTKAMVLYGSLDWFNQIIEAEILFIQVLETLALIPYLNCPIFHIITTEINPPIWTWIFLNWSDNFRTALDD